MTEPEEAASYSKVEYWNARYASEPEYDWFQSVYQQCLDYCVGVIQKVANATGKTTIRVLHLGTGNSALVADVAKMTNAHGIVVHQVGLDYSEVVISNMKQRFEIPNTEWVVGDVRKLRECSACAVGGFDIIIDKGTMDALQADKENDVLDEDLDAMLTEVSACLSTPGAFVQFTWETPYYRLHVTKKKEYGWDNDQLFAKRLPESDMYYVFCYMKL